MPALPAPVHGENSPNQDFALWAYEPSPHPIPQMRDHPLPHRGRGQGEGATGNKGVHGEWSDGPARGHPTIPYSVAPILRFHFLSTTTSSSAPGSPRRTRTFSE